MIPFEPTPGGARGYIGETVGLRKAVQGAVQTVIGWGLALGCHPCPSFSYRRILSVRPATYPLCAVGNRTEHRFGIVAMIVAERVFVHIVLQVLLRHRMIDAADTPFQ